MHAASSAANATYHYVSRWTKLGIEKNDTVQTKKNCQMLEGVLSDVKEKRTFIQDAQRNNILATLEPHATLETLSLKSKPFPK